MHPAVRNTFRLLGEIKEKVNTLPPDKFQKVSSKYFAIATKIDNLKQNLELAKGIGEIPYVGTYMKNALGSHYAKKIMQLNSELENLKQYIDCLSKNEKCEGYDDFLSVLLDLTPYLIIGVFLIKLFRGK